MTAAVKPSRGLFGPAIIVLLALLTLSLVLVGLGAIYVEYGKRILVRRGIAQPDQLKLRRVSLDSEHLLEFTFDALDSPATETKLYLKPWLDGFVAFKPGHREYSR